MKRNKTKEIPDKQLFEQLYSVNTRLDNILHNPLDFYSPECLTTKGAPSIEKWSYDTRQIEVAKKEILKDIHKKEYDENDIQKYLKKIEKEKTPFFTSKGETALFILTLPLQVFNLPLIAYSIYKVGSKGAKLINKIRKPKSNKLEEITN